MVIVHRKDFISSFDLLAEQIQFLQKNL